MSWIFLSDPGKPGVRSLGPDVRLSLSPTPCVDLTDVTLADEDTKSILTDKANRAIQAMWQCMLVIWWSNLQLKHVAPSGSQICN